MTDSKNKTPAPGQPSGLGKFNRGPINLLLMGLFITAMFITLNRWQRVSPLDYSPEFLDHIRQGHIKSVRLEQDLITGTFNEAGMAVRKAAKPDAPENFEVQYPEPDKNEKLKELLEKSGVDYSFNTPKMWLPLLVQGVLPVVLIGAMIYFLFIRNMKSGGGMLMNFGRSKHRVRAGKDNKITFANVAGIDEAKEEVAEVIEFLKNPRKFKKIGGRIPRGVLLVGPPGCGKTLLARAIAGESDVPFFSISGSDFVEMFVGVGASRVRDLFKQAKENAPCIIFLDEIDAIGKKRGPGFVSGGHDEREQTLNAILVEMDGFDTDDQVIMIAATNRADILDNALTRPGRFDRQVVVPLPDLQGRLSILKIHAQKIKIGPDVTWEKTARGTPMFSGAELEALINEAAIGASMQNKDYVEMADLEEARDKVRWGRAKKSRKVDEQDRRMTAYHEAGHALVQSMLKDADPLHKVSIIPRGPMGGATFALPEKDRFYYSKKFCIAQIQIGFGGRIAEDMFCQDITSGASSDIRHTTMIAREMVMEWGMGEQLGPINYASDPMSDPYAYGGPEYSQKTAEMIDVEVRKLIDSAYTSAKDLLETNRDKVEALAEALLKYETLDAEDVKVILAGGILEKPTISELLAKEEERQTDDDAKDKEDQDEDLDADPFGKSH
jgi:cell division protease FtsH